MLLFLLLSALTLAAESAPRDRDVRLERGSCPLFWYSFRGRCYKYVATRMTWADAELFCVSQGANLVSIHSLEEHDFVSELIENFDPYEGYTWIGLSDTVKEEGWMWSDGSAVSFGYWNDGQPDNHRNEDCVNINSGSASKWNDWDCSFEIPSVCATRKDCPYQRL